MIDHISHYTENYPATIAFYDATLGALGCVRQRDMVTSWDPARPNAHVCAYGPPGRPIMWVMESAKTASPRHVAFSAKSEEEVKAWYAAGLEAGGKDNGPPGIRAHYHAGYYGAFLIDPDGNGVEAVWHDVSKLKGAH